MTGRDEMAFINLLMLAAALLCSTRVPRPTISLPAPEWRIVAESLSCPYLMPPDCVDPIPGP